MACDCAYLIVPADIFAHKAARAARGIGIKERSVAKASWLSGFGRVSAVNLNVLAHINQGCR